VGVLQVCWAGPHTLAFATDQSSAVRLLQLETDDNCILDINQTEFLQADSNKESAAGNQAASGITALAYEASQQVLAAATVGGRVCLFKRWAGSASAEQAALSAAEPKQWEPQQCFQVGTRDCHMTVGALWPAAAG
jgi:hypothetical protein